MKLDHNNKNYTICGTPRLNKTAADWHPEIKQLRSWLLINKMSVQKNTKVTFDERAERYSPSKTRIDQPC